MSDADGGMGWCDWSKGRPWKISHLSQLDPRLTPRSASWFYPRRPVHSHTLCVCAWLSNLWAVKKTESRIWVTGTDSCVESDHKPFICSGGHFQSPPRDESRSYRNESNCWEIRQRQLSLQKTFTQRAQLKKCRGVAQRCKPPSAGCLMFAVFLRPGEQQDNVSFEPKQ